MIRNIQVFNVPTTYEPGAYQFHAVTVVDGEVVSVLYHEDMVEDGMFVIRSEVQDEYVGWMFRDTPFSKNVQLETWYDEEVGS